MREGDPLHHYKALVEIGPLMSLQAGESSKLIPRVEISHHSLIVSP